VTGVGDCAGRRVALAAAGALALRSRNEVRLRRRLVPLAAASSVAGVALASVAAACCLISQTSAREVPHAFGDPSEGPASGGANQPASGHPATPDRPVMLALPSVGVMAPVIAVGVSEGNLQVPEDPAQVGWWTSSAEAGAASTDITDTSIPPNLGAPYRWARQAC
jgi:hypothetical protein